MTTRGLRLGETVVKLRRLYPTARLQPGRSGFWPTAYWLLPRYSRLGEGGFYPGLLASVRNGKVSSSSKCVTPRAATEPTPRPHPTEIAVGRLLVWRAVSGGARVVQLRSVRFQRVELVGAERPGGVHLEDGPRSRVVDLDESRVHLADAFLRLSEVFSEGPIRFEVFACARHRMSVFPCSLERDLPGQCCLVLARRWRRVLTQPPSQVA